MESSFPRYSYLLGILHEKFMPPSEHADIAEATNSNDMMNFTANYPTFQRHDYMNPDV
jgi:hypothetical protein